jgi:hypothetical protein
MPPLALLWVWICAALNCAGWGLSAGHSLNAFGYGVFFLLGLLLLLVWRRTVSPPGLLAIHESRFSRRWRQPLPLAFLVLTGLMVLGGMLYAPSNYDGMTYREARVLHWLAADQWHWIHTLYPRLNTRASGVEWVSAPLILFTHSDRLLFLINVVSYLLLPGLVFSVFTRLGVRPRVAWHWMWIVPTGYCFLLQGGSSGNDLFGAPFALAAVDLALRARSSHRARDFFGSILAVALLTSAKSSNLPLLLVWGVAILPSWRLVFHWPLRLAVTGLVAAGCSFLPTALLNQHYCGDWSGVKPEGVCEKSDPPLRLASNLAVVTLQNLNPPVFPLAGQWNEFVTNRLSPELRVRLRQTVVEPGAVDFHLAEMQIEEDAGLGFGVCLLLLLSVVGAIGHRGARFPRAGPGSEFAWWQISLRWLPLVSLLALLSQSQVSTISRIMAPYYPLLLPAFLAGPAQAWVVGQRWWRVALALVYLLAALLLVISPPRPLFPAITLFSALHARHPESRALTRADTIYQLYRLRSEAFAPALAELPPNLKILGVFTYDDPETSLWRPFGSRCILHVRPEDTTRYLKQQGIEYVLINSGKFETWFHITPAEWVQNRRATVVKKIPLTLRASEGVVDWWLVKLP